jgi:hypothetical protein
MTSWNAWTRWMPPHQGVVAVHSTGNPRRPRIHVPRRPHRWVLRLRKPVPTVSRARLPDLPAISERHHRAIGTPLGFGAGRSHVFSFEFGEARVAPMPKLSSRPVSRHRTAGIRSVACLTDRARVDGDGVCILRRVYQARDSQLTAYPERLATARQPGRPLVTSMDGDTDYTGRIQRWH